MSTAAIEQFIGGAALRADEIGESPCDVYSFKRGNDRLFLKAFELSWHLPRIACYEKRGSCPGSQIA